jgi:TIR domain/WD domain, G-beta repeat
MPDGHVFVSYGRADRDRARRLATLLDERGFDVWWDPKIEPGVSYDRIIEQALADAGCVVALWSADSVESDWVRAEADEGRKRRILVPVLVEEVEPPLQFRLIETLDLTRWVSGDDPPTIERLWASIARHVEPSRWMTRWMRGLTTDTLHHVVLGPQPDWVSTVRFNQDGSVLTAGGDGWLRSWSGVDGSPGPAAKAHQGSAWSATVIGSCVASGGADGAVRVADADTLAETAVLHGHGGWVLGCAAGDGDNVLASSSRDATVRVWGAGEWRDRALLSGHRGAVWSVDFAADGDRLISASDDQTVRVWSWRDATQLVVLRDHEAPVMAARVLPDGVTAVSGGYDGTVLRWDLGNGQVVQRYTGGAGWILSLTCSPDGQVLIAGTSTGAILLWQIEDGDLIGTLHAHRGPVMSVEFRESWGLLSGSADKSAGLLRVRSLEEA